MVGGQRHVSAALPRERDPIPIIHKIGCATGSVRMRAENRDPTRIRPSNGPTCREQIHRLHHPGPFLQCKGEDGYYAGGSTADSYL